MKNCRKYIFLVFSLLSVFVLGAYTSAVIHGGPEIETSQWITVGFFGVFFVANLINEIKE